jgi:hypothetical protein
MDTLLPTVSGRLKLGALVPKGNIVEIIATIKILSCRKYNIFRAPASRQDKLTGKGLFGLLIAEGFHLFATKRLTHRVKQFIPVNTYVPRSVDPNCLFPGEQ